MREHMRKRVIFSLMLSQLSAAAFAAGGEAAAPEPTAEQVKKFEITDKYTHEWIRFPDAKGHSLKDSQVMEVLPKKGEATVLFFVASWCLPCQKLAPSMQEIRKKYQSQSARIVWVFAQDTLKDAQGFMKAHKLDGDAILADKETLKAFLEPELPSVYMGDRTNWLALRYLKVNRDQLKELSEVLADHTSY